MKTPIRKMIQWSIENAFNVTAEDGTTYIATDTEEMRLKFDLWLEEEKEHLVDAYDNGYKACDLDEAMEINKTMFSGERYYNQKYK